MRLPTASQLQQFCFPGRSELIIISLMVPQASFLGHLAGILCGFAFLACAFPFGWARTSARYVIALI